MGPKAFPSISNAVCLPNIYGMFSSSKTKLPHLPKGEISWSINTAWVLTFLWSRTSLLAAMIPINEGSTAFCAAYTPIQQAVNLRPDTERKPAGSVLPAPKWISRLESEKHRQHHFLHPSLPYTLCMHWGKVVYVSRQWHLPNMRGNEYSHFVQFFCQDWSWGLQKRRKKTTITESKARQSINFCSKPGIALVRFASLFQTGIGWFQVSPSYRTREGSQHILISLPFMLKATQAEDEPFCSVRFQTSSGHHQHLSPKLSCIMGHSAVKPLHQPWCPQRYLSSPTLFPQKGVLSGVLSPLDCKELYTAATLSHYSSIWRTRGKTLSSGS